MDWEKLLEIAPLLIAAQNNPARAAALHGWMQSQGQIQQGRMQQQKQQQEDAYRRAQMDNQAFQQQTQAENTQRDNERADAQLALNRLSAYRREDQGMLGALQQTPETALPPDADPLQAQNALTVERLNAQQQYGVPAGTPQGPLPNMTAAISEGKKRRARARYAEFLKSYKDHAADSEGSLKETTGEFAGQTFAQIREMAESLPPPPAPAKIGRTAVPGSFEEYIDAPPERQRVIEAGRKRYQQADDRPLASQTPPAPGTLPPAMQRRVDQKARGFDQQPVVKSTQKMAEAVSFANSLDPNTKNPADDQALIYAFAKAMDPDSVVREGEYATVQKYAQSWAETFGFNAARIFTNTSFLAPQARQNMKTTIQKKYQAGKAQYDNVRQSYAKQIDKITGQGDGESWLVDYGSAFPGENTTGAPPAATPSQNPFRTGR